MKINISKDLLYQILFALCIGVTYINIFELTFLTWLIAFVLTIKKKYSLSIIKHVIPFIVIFIVAFVMFFFYNHSIYNAIRDTTYLVKPIIGLILGYQLCKSYSLKPFKTIIYTGLMISIIHLTIIFSSVLIYKIINIHKLRELSGYFSDFEVYSLILILFYKQLQLGFSKKKFIILLLIVGISSFLYLSRTNFIQFIILYLGMKGYYRFNKQAIKIFATFFFLSIIGYTIVYNTNPSRNGKGLEALLYKIKNAPIEPFKTKVNKHDYQDFNDNFRSYENIITVKQVTNEGTTGVLFGKGLGSTIDIGRKIMTNDGTLVRYAPILHNGYMTVFLKAGLFGVFLQLYFFYILLSPKKALNYKAKQIDLILISTAIFLIISNWVLLGLYLKLDNKAIIIGFLIAYKELVTNNENLVENKI